MQTKTQSLTRILLPCGAIAGPLFLFTVLIQDTIVYEKKHPFYSRRFLP